MESVIKKYIIIHIQLCKLYIYNKTQCNYFHYFLNNNCIEKYFI